MSRRLTAAATLDNLRNEARRWQKALRRNDANARERFQTAYPDGPTEPALRHVQFALAREYGFASWKELKQAVETRPVPEYDRVAEDFVAAYEGDTASLDRLNRYYDRGFTMDDLKAEIWRRNYAFRQRSSRVPKNFLALEEARIIIAQDAGFSSWNALIDSVRKGAPPDVDAFEIDEKENRIAPRRRLNPSEWDDLVAVAKERRVAGIESNGLVTDAALARIAELEHVTRLSLGGSRELTDDGLLQLARMPQLEFLDLSEYPGGKLTDRGLEVLRYLPNLKRFEMTWQKGITDAGVGNLRYCEKLEHVQLMGSPTGDGAIEALQGKPRLRFFGMGRLVTDAGLPLLQNFPLFKNWDGEGARLIADGPFTDAGVTGLVGLEGIRDLDLFWHVTGITPNAFVHLIAMPHLEVLGCDGELANDVSFVHIAKIPRLRNLRAQEAAASDEGFVALARSQTLEGFWGRDSAGFGSRGFAAFSKMPALRKLGVSCKNVDDRALAALPEFPQLRELTPIGFTDDGFRHIGRCKLLERLTCMYCRETGDAATEHIRDLRITYYYAGLTKITDRSLEILGGMPSLEQVELYEVNGVTDAGLPFLAALPKLREVHLDSLPGVTLQGTRVFPARVRVKYST